MMANKYFPGAIINGVELIEKDLERSDSKNTWWKYKCPKCGTIKSARNSRVGSLCQSCSGKKNRAKVVTSFVTDDLTGKTFGYLTVLGKAPRCNFWHCRCKCGTEKDIFRGSLTSGDTKSCGCIRSWGETQIAYLLNQYNLPYKKEVTFPDLFGTGGGKLRFDFGVYNEDALLCLIEYDGRQHAEFNENWRQTREFFEQLQEHDRLKNEYCEQNNIKLYRLTKKDNIEDTIKEIKIAAAGTKGGA